MPQLTAQGGVRPDITYWVLGEHYEEALAKSESTRWLDGRDARPVWKGRRVWRLPRFAASRALYRLMAFANERDYREKEASTQAVA